MMDFARWLAAVRSTSAPPELIEFDGPLGAFSLPLAECAAVAPPEGTRCLANVNGRPWRFEVPTPKASPDPLQVPSVVRAITAQSDGVLNRLTPILEKLERTIAALTDQNLRFLELVRSKDNEIAELQLALVQQSKDALQEREKADTSHRRREIQEEVLAMLKKVGGALAKKLDVSTKLAALPGKLGDDTAELLLRDLGPADVAALLELAGVEPK